jgi:trans-aconitate methyltransferase
MSFKNVYEDARRAAAYATLGFPGTYHLAYRDIPALVRRHVNGRRALDFGCGTGRSTRFLRPLGFVPVGIDISADMVRRARERDPEGDYRVIADGDFSGLTPYGYDLVLSMFTFDNIPGREHKVALFAGLRGLLSDRGRMVSVVSSPDIYTHEWASFTTQRFAGNFTAKCGDPVFTVMKDVDDPRPVEDVLWPHEDYLDVYARAGLEGVEVHKPLGRDDEGVAWVSETTVAPWVVYVLKAAGA